MVWKVKYNVTQTILYLQKFKNRFLSHKEPINIFILINLPFFAYPPQKKKIISRNGIFRS